MTQSIPGSITFNIEISRLGRQNLNAANKDYRKGAFQVKCLFLKLKNS